MKINEAVLARLCQLVYEDQLDAHEFEKYDSVQIVGRGGSRALVLHKNRTAIVVCRGTRSFLDSLADVRFLLPVRQKYGYVHRGFRNRADRLWDDRLGNHLFSRKPKVIYLIGHSLGGAMAEVLAADLCQADYAGEIHLVTIGKPRAGTEEHSNRLAKDIELSEGEIHLFVNGSDIVPRLPPPFHWPGLPKYRHPDRPTLIVSNNGIVDVYPEPTPDERIAVRLGSILRAIKWRMLLVTVIGLALSVLSMWFLPVLFVGLGLTFLTAPLTDHSSELYANRLKQYVTMRKAQNASTIIDERA